MTTTVSAIVYREGKGCRQYAFETADDLAAWAARHPYKNETLRVMVNDLDGFIRADAWVPAAMAADLVRFVRARLLKEVH